jgi:hypothetical protein
MTAATDWGMKGKQLKAFQRELKSFGKKEFPIINGMALNKTAFEARKQYVSLAERRFIMRNKWTVKSIRFQKVVGFKNQFSEVGSTMDYMEDQEFGNTKTKTGKHGVAIPTSTASNEARGAKPRRKKVIASRRRGRVQLHRVRVKAKNRVQHVVATVRAAADAGGRRFIYLPRLGKMGAGIYLITGGKRKPKLNLIYDLSRKSVSTPKRPTLKPAVDWIRPRMPGFYREAMEARLKKTLGKKS